MDDKAQPAAAKSSGILIGALCGIGAAFGWAAGFVAAKHGVSVGFLARRSRFSPFLVVRAAADAACAARRHRGLGGIGWGRGLVLSVLSGPPQAMVAYIGFMLVPLGHGTTIQPACAALSGLILATLVLGEHPTTQRIIGGSTIIAGLLVFGAESLATIGSHGVGGDLLFAAAGMFWASFGILLRLWRVSGQRAIAVVGALSILIYAPLHALLVGYDGILRMSLAENLLQMVVQEILAGVLPIYLFARTVILLGAGRAATFPALVPGFALIIGYLTLGVVPSIAQLIGLVIVVIGFRFALR